MKKSLLLAFVIALAYGVTAGMSGHAVQAAQAKVIKTRAQQIEKIEQGTE